MDCCDGDSGSPFSRIGGLANDSGKCEHNVYHHGGHAGIGQSAQLFMNEYSYHFGSFFYAFTRFSIDALSMYSALRQKQLRFWHVPSFCDKPLAVWTLICYDKDNRL